MGLGEGGEDGGGPGGAGGGLHPAHRGGGQDRRAQWTKGLLGLSLFAHSVRSTVKVNSRNSPGLSVPSAPPHLMFSLMLVVLAFFSTLIDALLPGG